MNISGKKFGHLTAIECVGVTNDKGTLWKCRCDCGKEVIVQNNNLKSGHTTSCGCKREEIYNTPEKRIEGLKNPQEQADLKQICTPRDGY